MSEGEVLRHLNRIATTLLAGTAVILFVIATVAIAPRPAEANPGFAAQTRLPCGRCHVSPSGGGPNTAFGKAFKANGYKLPGKKK